MTLGGLVSVFARRKGWWGTPHYRQEYGIVDTVKHYLISEALGIKADAPRPAQPANGLSAACRFATKID
jgi:hypothetical protein